MSDSSMYSRRALLATVGTGLVTTGGVTAAQQAQPQQRPAVVTDNGYVFQFRNCTQVRVGGNMRRAESVVVRAGFTDGGLPDSRYIFYDAEPGFSRDVATDNPFDSQPNNLHIINSAVVEPGGNHFDPLAEASNPTSNACRS